MCFGAASARALDVELDSDTSFQLYEVRSPGARAFYARRRLLSRLSLRLAHTFGEPDEEGRAIRLVADAQLRLDQDFGETCLLDRDLCVRAIDTTDLGGYQPLAADTRLDIPALWIETSGLPLGTSARVGRQLVLDSIGFARFDGVLANITPIRWVELEAYGGLLVRGTTWAGTPRSDPQGSIRLDADVPWAAPPADTWVAGAALEGRASRYVRVRLSFRHMWEQDGTVVSRVALAASSAPIQLVSLSAYGVYDLLSEEVIDAAAELSVGGPELVVRTGVDRHVPRFDPGTIWAWFSVAPISEAHVGLRWRASERVELGGAVRGRRAELATEDDYDAGIDAYARVAWEGFRIGGGGFVWTGSLGPLAGVSFDVTRPLFGWLELTLDASVWHFDDPNRQDYYGTVVSEALAAQFRLSPETLLFVEFSHAASRTVGHRFRGMIALRVDTWR